jgi:hypothetical protein
MINLLNDAGAHTEPRRDAAPAHQPLSSGQIANVEVSRSMRPERTATPPGPKFTGTADGQSLEAHVERRRKLAARIRLESPSRTEEEIEARLEQFGA